MTKVLTLLSIGLFLVQLSIAQTVKCDTVIKSFKYVSFSQTIDGKKKRHKTFQKREVVNCSFVLQKNSNPKRLFKVKDLDGILLQNSIKDSFQIETSDASLEISYLDEYDGSLITLTDSSIIMDIYRESHYIDTNWHSRSHNEIFYEDEKKLEIPFNEFNYIEIHKSTGILESISGISLFALYLSPFLCINYNNWTFHGNRFLTIVGTSAGALTVSFSLTKLLKLKKGFKFDQENNSSIENTWRIK